MLASSVRTFSVHLENLISVSWVATVTSSSFTLDKHQRLYRSQICAKSSFWSIFLSWKSTQNYFGFLSPNLFRSFRESDLSNLLFDCKINLRDVKIMKIETQLRRTGGRTGTPQSLGLPFSLFFFCKKRKWKVKELQPLSVSELAAVGLHMYVCSCEAITWGGRHANISAVPERATV